MQRPLETLPLAAKQREKLLQTGFKTAQEVLELSPLELSRELGIDKLEALAILKIVRGEEEGLDPCGPPSALSLFAKEQARLPITLLSNNLDSLFSSSTQPAHTPTGNTGLEAAGLPRGCVTEWCGAPGTGKTQLGLQLAVNVQIPARWGGVGGEAVYIDTEGSFVVERLAQIAQATIDHVRQTGCEGGEGGDLEGDDLLVRSMLEGVYYFRVHSYIEQLAIGYHLARFCKEHPKVRLVVMDSVAFHFRGGHTDMSLRTRLLQALAQSLAATARQYDLAVVLMNQMTTKVGSTNQSQLVPALGESWGHACTHRVALFWEGGQRKAKLFKSSCLPEATVEYDITQDGVRDPSHEQGVKRSHSEIAAC